jgi:hypothetical protein
MWFGKLMRYEWDGTGIRWQLGYFEIFNVILMVIYIMRYHLQWDILVE